MAIDLTNLPRSTKQNPLYINAPQRTSPYSTFTTPRNYSALNPGGMSMGANNPGGRFSALSGMGANAPGGNLAPTSMRNQNTFAAGMEQSGKNMYAKPAFKTSQNKPNVPPNQLGQNLLDFATSGGGQAFAQGLLDKSGYSTKPVSFGEALASGMKSMSDYNTSQAELQFQKDQFEYQKGQDEISNALAAQEILLKTDKPTDLMKNIEAAGIDPKSDLGQKIITEYLIKPASSVNIDQKTESAIDVKKYELGSDLLKENRKVIQENRNINSKLEIMKGLIEDGKIGDTNRFTEVKKSISQTMNALGMLSETEQEELAGLESFSALVSYMVPRMRAVGSGSTSDFEAAMYQTAAPGLNNTPQGNLQIIAGFQQFNDYNIRYTNAMDKWLSKNNNLDGFEEDWIANNGDGIFHSYSNQEEIEDLVSSGKLKKNQYVNFINENGIQTVQFWDGS